MRHQEKWSEHTKLLPPLKIGDRVRIQNQTGSHPNKWDRTGIVTEVRQFHQYLIRIDGSGRQTLRNRKFLRKYIPMYQPAKRRSILEDIAHLPPTPPSDATTTSPKLLTDPPPTPTHTPRKDTTSPTTPTRPDTGVNIPPPQTSHSPDSLITPPTSYKSYSTFTGTHTTGTHTYREPYPNPTTTEEIHQNQEAPYTVTMRKLSFHPPSHTDGLKTWGEIENIEHDYLTHTYVIYSVVSIIDS